MILQRIEIEQFGGLRNFSLSLAPGLQYIYGENEAGKSTVCAFLSAMFYGMPGKVRGGGLKGDSRRLYMPWGEKYMAGTLHFRAKGQDYVLKRRFGATARGDSCSLLSADDWTELPIEPEELGVYFLGMGADAFRKSLFISQLGAAFSKGREDELMSRLSNLEKTGEEDISIQKALAELSRAEYELVTKTGRGGMLAQLENEAEALRAELLETGQKHASFRSLLEEIQRLTVEKEQGEKRLAELERDRAAAAAFGQYKKRQAERSRREKQHEEIMSLQASITEKQLLLEAIHSEKEPLTAVAALGKDIVLQLAEKEAACSLLAEKEKQRQKLLKEAELLQAEVEKGKKELTQGVLMSCLPAISIAVLCLSVALGVLLAPAFYGLIAISAGLGLLSIKNYRRRRQLHNELAVRQARLKEKQDALAETEQEQVPEKLQKLRQEMAEVLEKADAENLAALAEKAEQVRQLTIREEVLDKELVRLAEELQKQSALLAEMPELPEEAEQHYEGADTETIEQQLEQQRKQQMERERRLALLNAKVDEGFSGTRSLSVIESALEENAENRAQLAERYEAIKLAKTALEDCAEEMKSNFAPALNEQSGKLIARLTGGKYSEVRITDDYGMLLKTPDGREIIEADYVSAGTCDLLYFSLRLAVLSILNDEIPLLIMDDTFLQLDAPRRRAAFGLLREKPAEQILYFSCHEPEEELNDFKLNLN